MHVDFLEAGSGPLVMLVHSSVSGARQWRALMDDLKSHFQARAVNLFGYGKTPPWPAESRQSLADQARLVEAALPAGEDQICLVGHSFGGGGRHEGCCAPVGPRREIGAPGTHSLPAERPALLRATAFKALFVNGRSSRLCHIPSTTGFLARWYPRGRLKRPPG